MSWEYIVTFQWEFPWEQWNVNGLFKHPTWGMKILFWVDVYRSVIKHAWNMVHLDSRFIFIVQ